MDGNYINQNVRQIDIPAATDVEETPFLVDTVYTYGSGNVGYMVFNSFYDPNNEYKYNERLESIFKKFKDNNVSKLIVDVRYNPGGYVTTLRELASYIMPNKKDQVLCHLINNRDDKTTYKFITHKVMGTIRDVVVLASRYSASESEELIHCLKP